MSYVGAQNAQIGIQKWCPYGYWHYTLVQYQFGHGPLPVMAFKIACTSTGIFALWFITSMGRFHYWYWQSKMPVLVLAFLHFGSVSVWAHSITGHGIQSCPYRYWHFCILVQYQYGHGPLPKLVLAFLQLIQYQYGQIPLLVLTINDAHTGVGIFALWFSISMGTFHYW